MSYKWGSRSKERMDGVHKLLTECATRALAISKNDMTIPGSGGLRTAAEQKELFKKGYSQLDGFEKKSYHQSGFALDVIPLTGYNDAGAFRNFAKCMFYSWQLMQKEGKIPDSHFLEYGGHWSNFVDVPHWQIKIK